MIFTDESSFYTFNNVKRVWCKPWEQVVVRTVKHCAKVHAWGLLLYKWIWTVIFVYKQSRFKFNVHHLQESVAAAWKKLCLHITQVTGVYRKTMIPNTNQKNVNLSNNKTTFRLWSGQHNHLSAILWKNFQINNRKEVSDTKRMEKSWQKLCSIIGSKRFQAVTESSADWTIY